MNDEALKESLQDLYERAPCGYVFTLPDGAFARVNQTFLEWTGYTRDELLRGRLQDLLTVPGKMFYENQYAPLLRMQGTVQEVAFDIVRRDGTRLPVLINSVLRVDAGGAPTLVASTIFSAVDRRTYERELLLQRTRAEQLAEVVTASSDAIITCSFDGVLQRWNRSTEDLFGYGPEELSALRLYDLLPFGGEARYQQILQSLWKGKDLQEETVAVRAGGERLDVSVGITPHRDELGTVSALSAIIRDISERRQVERLQQEFLAMASHELRSPLTAIRGQAQLMQRRSAYSEQGVEAIIAQTRTLSRLVEDLLLASQIEADRLELHLIELDLVSAARAAAQYIVSDVHDIHVNAPDHPVVIRADPRRLDQVFTNMLTNAVKYSPEGGDVVVRIVDDEHEVCLDVIDHGIGIRRDDMPKLFNRFYRAADAARRTEGTGLGLYIVRRIVEAHGGTIDVESEPGRGSRFTLAFPAAKRADPG